ncbi:DgyrCDS7171 [Dimorphilus gyrociliatus]|uniref:DgyrCDS7171 n=1 Tax=Dimorphilus gyrociliatus TaxID=2664684 RepID=A0A7I8VQ77_9ANNE|nr:DgyrCDS7171 [Dimorphilus gyrociliatus]
MSFKLILYLFSVLFIGYSESAEICCSGLGCFSDNRPFDHLPLPSCPDVISPIFNLYTRSNRNSPQRVYRNGIPSLYRGVKRTVFLVHGFNNNENVDWIIEMKNAFLIREDVNVIVTGWGGGAETIDYPWAASNTRVVGAEIGVTAENLIINGGSSLSRMWCVGHSLGAHTCGHAGKKQKFARITGLDPAGPLFENYDIEAGLNPTRGNFVDIIHTAGKDGGIIDFGTLKALGHADFYPNNGGFQPGCFLKMKNGLRIACSHGRACAYFTESVLANIETFSTICWLYAKLIYQMTKRPWGLTMSAWEATRINDWSSAEQNTMSESNCNQNAPTFLYHSIVIVVLYQGEANTHNPAK